MRYSFDKLKKQPYFKIGDIIIYSAVAVIAVVLGVVFLVPQNDRALDTINIYYESNLIYVYDCEQGIGSIEKGHESYIFVTAEHNKTLVTINTKDGHNIVEISPSSARMAEADCSYHADCEHFKPITEGGDIIVCLPNKIKVVGEGRVLGNEVKL